MNHKEISIEEFESMKPLEQAKAIVLVSYQELLKAKKEGAPLQELREKEELMFRAGAYAIANLDPLDAERMDVWLTELNLKIQKARLKELESAAEQKDKEVKE